MTASCATLTRRSLALCALFAAFVVVAVTLLPISQVPDFVPCTVSPASTPEKLALSDAALPCRLERVAITLLAATPVPEA
ncbi:MAG: hypothetical protein WCC57_05360 [Paracoccaceae bacterium]